MILLYHFEVNFSSFFGSYHFSTDMRAIFAKEIAKKVRGVDYRLLIVAAYSGFVVWHAGLLGSISLTLSSGGEALSKSTAGILSESIPSSMTIFSSFNLIMIGIIVLVLSFFTCSYPSYKRKYFRD